MSSTSERLGADGRTYAWLAGALAVLAVVGWIAFEGALSGGFGPACDGCVERTDLSPGPGVGLWLGASVMLTVFSAAAAVASVILHAGARHLRDSARDKGEPAAT